MISASPANKHVAYIPKPQHQKGLHSASKRLHFYGTVAFGLNCSALYSSKHCKDKKKLWWYMTNAGWIYIIACQKKKQKKVMTVILSQAHEQWNRKDNSLLPLKAHWVTLTLSAATLPACIYCLDSLNQFSMCQALPNRAKMARTSKTLAVSAWRSGCHVCWLSPGQQGWRCAWARWQHVAELQDCQTMNVSMTPTVPHQMHQSWVDENSHSRSDTRRHERVFD